MMSLLINSVYPPPDPLFRVELLSSGEHVLSHGIPIIKAIRHLTGLGLREAKELYDKVREGYNSIIKEGMSEGEAKIAKRELEAAGGIAQIVRY